MQAVQLTNATALLARSPPHLHCCLHACLALPNRRTQLWESSL